MDPANESTALGASVAWIRYVPWTYGGCPSYDERGGPQACIESQMLSTGEVMTSTGYVGTTGEDEPGDERESRAAEE